MIIPNKNKINSYYVNNSEVENTTIVIYIPKKVETKENTVLTRSIDVDEYASYILGSGNKRISVQTAHDLMEAQNILDMIDNYLFIPSMIVPQIGILDDAVNVACDIIQLQLFPGKPVFAFSLLMDICQLFYDSWTGGLTPWSETKAEIKNALLVAQKKSIAVSINIKTNSIKAIDFVKDKNNFKLAKLLDTRVVLMQMSATTGQRMAANLSMSSRRMTTRISRDIKILKNDLTICTSLEAVVAKLNAIKSKIANAGKNLSDFTVLHIIGSAKVMEAGADTVKLTKSRAIRRITVVSKQQIQNISTIAKDFQVLTDVVKFKSALKSRVAAVKAVVESDAAAIRMARKTGVINLGAINNIKKFTNNAKGAVRRGKRNSIIVIESGVKKIDIIGARVVGTLPITGTKITIGHVKFMTDYIIPKVVNAIDMAIEEPSIISYDSIIHQPDWNEINDWTNYERVQQFYSINTPNQISSSTGSDWVPLVCTNGPLTNGSILIRHRISDGRIYMSFANVYYPTRLRLSPNTSYTLVALFLNDDKNKSVVLGMTDESSTTVDYFDVGYNIPSDNFTLGSWSGDASSFSGTITLIQ